MLPAEDRFLKTVCIDKKCQAVFYISPSERILECYQCGQKYGKELLQEKREVSTGDVKEAFQNFLCRMLINRTSPKRGTEMVKVHGLSNYYCKLLSPLLTRYGMDKNTGRAKLLTDMNQGEIFDCSLLSDRAFLIDPEHIPIAGYGRDITGSLDYLSETLKLIVASNGVEERLIPIHADGDGHCLVHAVSRALVGRELFWHPLRCCLKKHFETNIEKYKELFKDFVDTDEWACIIEECDPNFQPPEGELHGLRNIHIFGLANVLRRPIILLDSLDCMQKCGDYSALFLPGFVSPEACRGKDNTLNKPLCIAWSSHSHNHYIPLVGVQKLPLPVLPSALIPKVWGMPQSQILSYMEFDNNGSCIIGGNRVLSSGYIQRLVHAMEVLFYETNGIHPTLVADAKLYLFPDNILFSAKPATVLERARTAVQESRLYRCLFCRALCELRVEDKWLATNTALCSHILQNCKRVHNQYNFMHQGICYKYDATKDEIVVDLSRSEMQTCTFCACHNSLRKVTNDGTVIYKAEDKDNPDKSLWYSDQAKKFLPEENFNPQCTQDTKPAKITVNLKWEDKEVEEEVSCIDLQQSSKESLNEFVKELSKKLIDKHFPGESSNSKLQEYLSEEIWKQIRKAGLKRDSEFPSKSEIKKQIVKTENAEVAASHSVQLKLPSSELQYVKVVTSNGQQANLTLTEEGVSYGQLQEWIRNEFNIPVKNQRIKLGFPPKEIVSTGDTNKEMLPLKHGDRLMVEINQKEESAASLLSSLTHQRNVTKINRFTKFQSEVMWNMVKSNPANFRRGGCIYEQIEENNRLHCTLHAELQGFENMVFCYNSMTDSIDLCVKPLGHFLVSSDIDTRIEQVRKGDVVLGFSKCPLMSKLKEMSSTRTFLRTASSQNLEETERQPLLRKGPGFSILTSPPDDMDIS